MINVFKVRKIAALLLMGLFPTIMFFIAVTFWSFLYGLAFLAAGLLLGYLIANIMLKNPFTAMLEGKGILAINFDSTGVLKPFIVGLKAPYVKGILNGKEVNDVWDREATFNFAVPKKAGTAQQITEGKKSYFKIELSEKEYNAGRFAMYHYPCILWNEQTNSLLTKDFFSEKEKNAFTEHGVLYMNRKLEELTGAMLNFGRYVVEQLKPKMSILQNKWFWIIIIVVGVIMLALFAKPIIQNIQGVASGGLGAAITPTG